MFSKVSNRTNRRSLRLRHHSADHLIHERAVSATADEAGEREPRLWPCVTVVSGCGRCTALKTTTSQSFYFCPLPRPTTLYKTVCGLCLPFWEIDVNFDNNYYQILSPPCRPNARWGPS
ncbi:hypothetical protein EVAR_62919_1 [Eumeta japonica]|uniref:Uncharacterized protein n=1 Tax=Eumeta variegata TaxID=151549 RepID=A0A4C1ZP67_EUMVA|nr:hypothetical protein EVAR_62919_1 [Eumeta japonica]